MGTTPSAAPPLLLLEAVERDPEVATRLIGKVRAGGHRLRIVLDFHRGDLRYAEYVEFPWLLALHEPSRRAVVSALARIDEGKTVLLPRDLSAEVRQAEEPCPWQPLDEQSRAALDAAADRVAVVVRHAERSSSCPPRVQAWLELDGRSIEVDAEIYAEEGAVPIVRYMAGTDPAELTPAQRRATQRVLLEYR
jgi:hypothetical protein